MAAIYKTIKVQIKNLLFIPFILAFTSCGLFDKEIKQDQRIGEFIRQMNRVQDSIDNNKGRIDAFRQIIDNIKEDKALITPRKKNILLVESYVHISKEFMQIRNYVKALSFADSIIHLDSSSPTGYYTRGCIYQTTENDSLAIIDYNKAINLNSDYVDAYYNRGAIYQKQEQYDQALADYNKALKLNPRYIVDLYNNRGDLYMAKNEWDNAIEDYSKIINIDSVNVRAFKNRAEAYLKQNEFEKAMSDYDKVLALDSADLAVYLMRASIYEMKEEYNNAIKDYEKIVLIDPQSEDEANYIAKEAIRRLKSTLKKSTVE